MVCDLVELFKPPRADAPVGRAVLKSLPQMGRATLRGWLSVMGNGGPYTTIENP